MIAASVPGFAGNDAAGFFPAMGTVASEPVDARLLGTPILVIEDEAVIAWTLESHLEDMGFTDIAIAADARAATASAAVRAPGLIVSDINLGGGPDGVVATAGIHAGGFVPTLFVTGYANADARARIEREVPGAAVLRKPIQPDELQRAINAALAGGPRN